MSQKITVSTHSPHDSKQDPFVLELQQLLACYQLATKQDREIVWSALNKYMPNIIQNP